MKLFFNPRDKFSYEILADLSKLKNVVNANDLTPQDIQDASLLLRKLL
jgi:hypothetical protein